MAASNHTPHGFPLPQATDTVARQDILDISNSAEQVAERADAIQTRPEATTQDMTLYVATTGNDTTGDGTQGGPYRTVMHALESLPPLILHQVTIIIASGTYTESVTVDGFIGNGTLTIKPVTNTVGSVTFIALLIQNVSCAVNVSYIDLSGEVTVAGINIACGVNNSGSVVVNSCRALTQSASGYGFVGIGGCFAQFISCTVTGKNFAFSSRGGRVLVDQGAVTSTTYTYAVAWGGIMQVQRAIAGATYSQGQGGLMVRPSGGTVGT